MPGPKRRAGRGTLHNLTAERGRRGSLPWSWTVDLAANHFHMRVRRSAGRVDLLAMAEAADTWARALRRAAKQLRAAAR